MEDPVVVDVAKEYQKDPQLSKCDVKKLVKWAEAQDHLPNITEFQAITFLHSTYYDLDLAKTTIDTFFKLRRDHSYMFGSPKNAKYLQDVMSVFYMTFLPDKTRDGDSIFICGLRDTKPAKFDMLQYQVLLDMVMMAHLYTAGTVNGLVQVFDFAGFHFGHVFRVSIKMAKTYAEYLQSGFPMRLKRIHFINTSRTTHTIINCMRPFVHMKIMEMMTFHGGDNTTIHEEIPPEILPKDMGGCGKSVDEILEGKIDELVSCAKLFQRLQKQTSLENKRRSLCSNE